MIFSNKIKDTIGAAGSSATIIGAGVTFTGDISSTSDIRIDGTIKGNVSCASRVLIGAEGVVEGNVDCRQADVMGKIKGNVTTKDLLYLRGKAFLEGDIYASKLQVEPPAAFNGHCHMNTSSVLALVEMNNENQEEPKAIAAE
ncbi:MAG: hypothetical protein JWQ09_1556 [Segetibacter sp.]|nr:hypothetical protein [Segetibacter sp.]